MGSDRLRAMAEGFVIWALIVGFWSAPVWLDMLDGCGWGSACP